MSVFKRTYRRYTGPLNLRRLSGVLVRYGAADLWGSRITNIIFLLCFVPALLSMAIIYIMNNDAVRMLLSGGHGPSAPPISIDERFFFAMMQAQCWPALVLIAWIGPRVISEDLANDALPIILSHPISRAEYVLAKFTILAGFLSAVTIVPLTLLFAFQSYMSAEPWGMSHMRTLFGIFAGCILWMAILSALALGVSAWVKWRIVATAMIFAVIFVPAAIGAVFNLVMRTNWGNAINIPLTMSTLWRRLLHVHVPAFMGRSELSTTTLLIALGLTMWLCGMALNARIRAKEVVRG
ncbi:MAG TPA: ABC-2 transporter permease [Terriglobales bacterium]|nr:ABC-2 transporter permease [Terriglobales bacterium]